MAESICPDSQQTLLGTTTTTSVTEIEGSVAGTTSTGIDVTEYLNLKTLFEETGVSDTTTSIGCGMGDIGVAIDLYDNISCSDVAADGGVYEEYVYESNSYTTQQLATWEGMTPEQQNLVSPTYYINKDGTITEVA
jgi:hypothetical protein